MIKSSAETSANKVNITNCDREPIHIIEQAQEHGVILVVDTKTQKILQASTNSKAILHKTVEELLGNEINQVLDKSFSENLFSKIEKKQTLYPTEIKCNIKPYLVIPHLSESDYLIIDIEPFEETVNPIFFQEELSKILKEIKETDSLNEMCQQAANLIKQMYGYDRVMLYKFDEEWNGEVIAEAKEEGLQSWLGLHYPATDIPKPARDIFLKQGVRMIANVHYEAAPLLPELNQKINLSKSELRGVSPIHIEYLKNMKVGASLTAAVILNGKLWGLIACHHSEPKFISYHKRQTCKFLAQVLANKLALKESNTFLENINSSETIRKKLLVQLNSINSSTDALTKFNPKFTDLINCSGGAVYNEKKITLVGNTPSEQQVKKIIKKVLKKQIDPIFFTKQLNRYYDKANEFTKTASGILSIRIGSEQNFVMWFRPEASTTVSWGGKPQKEAVVKDGVEYLHPRKSFEKWTEKVSGIANSWKPYDIEAAENLKDTITHVLVKKQKDKIDNLNESLVEVNKELETFSYSVSHDLRAPLRGIDGYSRILVNKYYDQLDEYGQNALETIVNSAEEMDLLIEDILTYSKVGQNKLNLSSFSAKKMVENIVSSQNVKNNHPNIQLEIDQDLPDITGDKRMISQVFSNLISNAVKYSSKKENPKVEIGYEINDKKTVFFVKDNGIGFDPSFKTEIFDVFSRVASSKDFSGSGIGLATVKKVVEKHNGEVWAESKPEQGASFYFYIDISEK